MFFLAALIIAIACSVITIKTLIGYSDMKLVYKVLVSLLIATGWFSVIILNLVKKYNIVSSEIYTLLSQILYGMLGFVFILFIIIMLRDIVWYTIYGFAKLIGKDGWYIDPKNMSLLGRANLIVIFVSMAISGYAFYQGYKLPEVKEIYLSSSKINGNVRIAHLSDLHITRATPIAQLQKIVNTVNMLNPDVIVVTGDVIDDNINTIEEQLNILKGFSAPYGVYSVMGNHEFYNDVYAAKKALDNAGLKFLFNGGVHIKNSNVFVTGIPDLGTMAERINFWRALNQSKDSDYKVLLSHAPLIIDSLSKGLVDIVLAGHTHGGQVFPFHWLAKQANKYLAGQYTINGTELYVSRGAGTWGPRMRLFAPSDITLIHLLQK